MDKSLKEKYIGWLNHGKSSFLKGHTLKYLKQIKQKKAEDDISGVMYLIEQVCGLCQREQKAETLVECAWIMYEIKDYGKAVDYFVEAQQKYIGDRHRLAVVLWMKGFMLWHIPTRHPEAVKTWVSAIEYIEKAREFTGDSPGNLFWFEKIIREMKETLDAAIDKGNVNFMLNQTDDTNA